LATNTHDELKRVIGIKGLAATIVNNTIGAGIYALPAIVSIQMGAFGITDYLFCALMLISIMFCYVEVGSRISGSGGSYIYVEAAFGKFAGFIINWLFFFAFGILGSAAIINVLADSLAVLFPVFTGPLPRALLYFTLLGLMAWINVRGAKHSIRFLQYITIAKLIPLLGIVIFGFSFIKTSNLHWEHLPSLKTFGDTALVLFFAFAGFETSLSVSGEIKDPGRTISRAILLGGVSVFIIYLLIQTVAQGVLGAQIAAFKNAPLAAVAEKIIGPVGATVLIIAAVVSCLGNISGDVLATPRLLFAGARDGLFPKFLAKVHPRFATPYIAVIIYAALIFVFATTGGFRQLAVLASCALLLIYLAVVLAMIRLRYKKENGNNGTFKVPGGLTVPLIAIASIVWLLANLSPKEVYSTTIFITVVALIYLVTQRFKTKP
jgi:amino acid transporter